MIDQVLDQIQSAFSDASEVHFSASSSILRNPNPRMDHNGNFVNDEAVFECTARYPFADLFFSHSKGRWQARTQKSERATRRVPLSSYF